MVAGDVGGCLDVQAEAAVVGWVDHPLDRAVAELVELEAGHLGGGADGVPVRRPCAASHVAAARGGEEERLEALTHSPNGAWAAPGLLVGTLTLGPGRRNPPVRVHDRAGELGLEKIRL